MKELFWESEIHHSDGEYQSGEFITWTDATNVVYIKKLQLWTKFQTSVMPSLRLLSIANASDHRRIKTVNLLHAMQLPNLFSHETYGLKH